MHPQKQVFALLKKGHSENGIATKINVAQSTIHSIKAGDVRSPRFDTVERLQKLYKKHLLGNKRLM